MTGQALLDIKPTVGSPSELIGNNPDLIRALLQNAYTMLKVAESESNKDMALIALVRTCISLVTVVDARVCDIAQKVGVPDVGPDFVTTKDGKGGPAIQ